ncbi:MAG: M6 family metalloprotease domain-containing protein [Bacteroidales bacterium]|nr:M6 family metalloprotease domain-containing protein [Bacteroidales bacterium]
MKKLFTIILLTFIVNVEAFAVPAYPHPIAFQQPNGDEVTVMIKGDERINRNESMDGYTLLYNSEGYLTYAYLDEDGNLQPSDVIATDVEKRDAAVNSFLNAIEKDLSYSDAQKQVMLKIWEIEDEYEDRGGRAVIGEYKTLCAFVQFPGKSFIKQMSDFNNLMNQIGYTGNGTGSVRDFFKESSYNKFDLTITLCGIYTAPKNESYYAGNGGTQNCQELARWAAQQVAAEPSINFADYDSNNDGKVDGFHFIFAGMGQEAGGGSGTIWSHKWQFYPSVTKNGKSISVYSCSPELLYGTTITTIGVICHEMTHAFGAPDFYDTNGTTNGEFIGTGMWDIMADGSWNGNPGGNRPAHHNMYTKVQFGWVTPVVLNSATTITNMPNSTENAVAYRINTGSGSEHYLLENRQKIKFDTNVPGAGLIIYHVHSSVGTSGINDKHPQRMYPVCASATVQVPNSSPSSYGQINSGGCPFPGTSNKTSFTSTSTPMMFQWTSTPVNKPITDITHSGGFISFKFMAGSSTQYTVAVSASPTNGGTVTGAGTYNSNASVTVTATPNTNFSFVNWTKNGTQVSTNSSYTFNITENTTLVANFKSKNANLTSLTVNHGTLSPTFNSNTTNYTVNVENTITTITITGKAADANATVTGNVTNAPLTVGNNNFTIKVTAQDGTTTKSYNVAVTRATASQYTITASVEGNVGGAISPEGEIKVNEGESVSFEMIADENYIIYYVLVDGDNVGTDNTHTFDNVTEDHTIVVKFEENTAINDDVKTDNYPSLRIYPNPTSGELRVTSYKLQVTSVEIFDVFGRTCNVSCVTCNENEMSISFLPAGIYFIRITTENGMVTRKVIKQ